MGQTSPDNLRWPEYADPAAVPQDMQELATDTQAALTSRTNAINGKRTLLVPYSGFSRTSAVTGLVADALTFITFENTYPQPPDTTAAGSMSWDGTWKSRVAVLHPGLHTLELDISVSHATAATVRPFEIGVYDTILDVWTSAVFTTYAAASGQPIRLPLHLSQHIGAGSLSAYVRPVGSAATGWTMTYARLVLKGV